MDAEKFDKIVLDLLYDELDELTRASAIRHTEQSGRAKALYSELRATREVGTLPLVEPPADLEARILEAEVRARAERPLGQRLGALVSIAASYAMRPQLGMAAVLLLMVGSSLLFLRVKPGPASQVQVTERGVPESEKESSRVVPLPAPRAADEMPHAESMPEAPRAARARGDAPKTDQPHAAAAAPAAREKEGFGEAEQPAASPPAEDLAFAQPPPPSDGVGTSAASGAAAGGPMATPTADDEEAKASAHAAGCEADLPRYEALMARPSTTPYASLEAARFAAAQCYARLGRVELARRTYRLLLTDPSYADPSRRALAVLPESTPRVADDSAPAKAAPKAAKPATSKPSP